MNKIVKKVNSKCKLATNQTVTIKMITIIKIKSKVQYVESIVIKYFPCALEIGRLLERIWWNPELSTCTVNIP